MDAETLALIGSSLRSLFDEGRDVVQGLDELGWQDVLDEDEAAATTLLFTEQGRALAPSRALDSVVSRALGVDPYAVVHPTPGTAEPPLAAGVRRGILLVHSPGPYLVPGKGTIAIVDSIGTSDQAGFDPEAGWVRAQDIAARDSVANGGWQAGVAAARRALASELIGLGRGALTLAVDQVSLREQFGKAIGSLQSPRHRLAEAHVALSAAENLVEDAWKDRDEWSAAVAKAQAGLAAETTAAAALQVCGALGLTAEHRLGNYVRRIFVVDSLYCGWRDLSRQVGRQLVSQATGRR